MWEVLAVWPIEEGCLQGVSEQLASRCQVVQPGQAFTKQTSEPQIPRWQEQSQGWVHYMIHEPEPHILLFRRPLPKKPKK